jgi:hypothetical protein
MYAQCAAVAQRNAVVAANHIHLGIAVRADACRLAVGGAAAQLLATRIDRIGHAIGMPDQERYVAPAMSDLRHLILFASLNVGLPSSAQPMRANYR